MAQKEWRVLVVEEGEEFDKLIVKHDINSEKLNEFSEVLSTF